MNKINKIEGQKAGQKTIFHTRRAEQLQEDLIRKMSPGRRLEAALSLYSTAWEMKKGGLRAIHPEWTESQIAVATRRIFQTGYAGD